MSGHVILDSCHHCGVEGAELSIVSSSESSTSCQFAEFMDQPKKPHIHVIVACGRCRESIWKGDPDTDGARAWREALDEAASLVSHCIIDNPQRYGERLDELAAEIRALKRS